MSRSHANVFSVMRMRVYLFVKYIVAILLNEHFLKENSEVL